MNQRWPNLAPLLLATLAGWSCSSEDGRDDVDEDLGAIESAIEFGDRINWPGVDEAAGRVIPLIRGFGNGRQAAYWFLGFASRETADSFWFCREGDDACPLDENRRLNWDHIVGRPVFSRIPGQSGFSPFWQMWRVTVPEDYVADSVKTTATLDRLQNDGTFVVEPFFIDFGELFGEYYGVQEVLLHCALVLDGTLLQDNGGEMPDHTGTSRRVELRQGWHEGYTVSFYDFSPSDGVFPEAKDSEGRPLMPFANIYIHWRNCDADPRPAICDLPGYSYTDRRPVSERGLGQDITDDGDPNDTNNVVGALPCELRSANEAFYSPLWGVQFTYVPGPGDIRLIDSYVDQGVSDIKSADDVFAAVDAGFLLAPEPQTEDSTGNPVPGNDGQVFFNCPNPVRENYVPYPCEQNDLPE